MTNTIKKLILMVYIIISFIVLFNMYNRDHYSFNNKRSCDNGIIRKNKSLNIKEWDKKRYYEDIMTDDGEYTFSFHRNYSYKHQQETLPEHDYYGAVLLKQNSTGNIKSIVYLREKLDNYVEFVAENKIRVNESIYLDLKSDAYFYHDKDLKIGGRFFYLVLFPLVVLPLIQVYFILALIYSSFMTIIESIKEFIS